MQKNNVRMLKRTKSYPGVFKVAEHEFHVSFYQKKIYYSLTCMLNLPRLRQFASAEASDRLDTRGYLQFGIRKILEIGWSNTTFPI